MAQDLQVDFKTIEKWITILENVYYCYRILPYGLPKIKAVKKEQKIYFGDRSELEDAGARWERPQKHGKQTFNLSVSYELLDYWLIHFTFIVHVEIDFPLCSEPA